MSNSILGGGNSLYLNNKVLLWENPDGLNAQTFPEQTITLSTMDFDIYHIIYLYSKANQYGQKTSMSQFAIKGTGTFLFLIDSNLKKCRRDVQTTNNSNELKFTNAIYEGYTDFYNYCLIPVYIIGYKNIF